MSLELLEKFATESGNEEAISALAGVKKSVNDNIARMKFLEQESKSAFEKRDAVTNTVKSKLGLAELNDDSLEEFLTKIKSNPDATMKAENDKLASMINSLKSEKDSIANEFNKTVNSYKVEKQLTSLGAVEETEGSKAYDIVLSEISKNISFDDNGNVVFKANDGTTMYNADGSPISLSDRYNQIKESGEFSFLFKTKRSKAGSGIIEQSSGKNGVGKGLQGSKEEQIAYIKSKFKV